MLSDEVKHTIGIALETLARVIWEDKRPDTDNWPKRIEEARAALAALEAQPAATAQGAMAVRDAELNEARRLINRLSATCRHLEAERNEAIRQLTVQGATAVPDASDEAVEMLRWVVEAYHPQWYYTMEKTGYECSFCRELFRTSKAFHELSDHKVGCQWAQAIEWLEDWNKRPPRVEP